MTSYDHERRADRWTLVAGLDVIDFCHCYFEPRVISQKAKTITMPWSQWFHQGILGFRRGMGYSAAHMTQTATRSATFGGAKRSAINPTAPASAKLAGITNAGRDVSRRAVVAGVATSAPASSRRRGLGPGGVASEGCQVMRLHHRYREKSIKSQKTKSTNAPRAQCDHAGTDRFNRESG